MADFKRKGTFLVLILMMATLCGADSLINAKWGFRVRGGAVGEVKIEEDKFIARRDNSSGEVLVLGDRKFEAFPNSLYQFEVELTGPENGAVRMLIPAFGGKPRSYPDSGVFSTTGKLQKITFDVATLDKENALGFTFFAVKPGVYTVNAVRMRRIGANPGGSAGLVPKADENLLKLGVWHVQTLDNAKGEGVVNKDEIIAERFNTLGTVAVTWSGKVAVKPGTRYRVNMAVNGPNDGSFVITAPVYGDSKRKNPPTRFFGSNGGREVSYLDFDTLSGDSAFTIQFACIKPGKYVIDSVTVTTIDPDAEYADMQKSFQEVWHSGDVPQADSRYSKNFKFADGRFFGKMAVLLKQAFPMRRLLLDSEYSPDDRVGIELVARDVNRRELLRAAATAKGVLIPEKAAYTYLELTAPSDGAPYRKLVVRNDVNAPESFHWRQWNSFEVGNPRKVPTRYRTRFNLAKLPVGAIGRFCTYARIFINGKPFGSGASGDTTRYYRNILGALKTGENEIVIDAANPEHQSLQIDVLLGFDDGTQRVLRSDDGTWMMCEYDSTQWRKVPVLLSTYKPEHFSQRWISPGEMPDEVVPVVEFKGNAEFSKNEISAQKSLPTELELDLKSWMFLGANRFDIAIVDSNNVKHWRQTVFGDGIDMVKGVNGKIKFKFGLCTEFLKPGTYHLETPVFLKGKIAGSFKVLKACDSKLDFAVDYDGFMPMFRVNGQRIPATIYRHYSRFKIGKENYFLQDFWRGMLKDGKVRIHIANAEMGPDIHKNANVSSGDMWIGKDKYDFGILDKMVENILAVDPDSLIFLSIGFDAPQWYLKENPDTRVIWHNGESGKGVSWASEKWRKDSTAALRELMRYCAAKPYASRIVGLFISGGYDGQWWNHLDMNFPFKITDYHPDMLQRFRHFLRARYNNDVNALRVAWNDKNVTFDNALMPSFEQRRGKGFYMDPKQGAIQVVDYIMAQADSLKTHLEELFAAGKSFNPRMFTGSYYVPNWDCSYRWGQAQRQMTDSMLDSKLYDFGASPMAYLYRTPNKIGHPLYGRNQYFRVNRKLEIFEDDNRTFKFAQMPVAMWGNYTPSDCVDTMRRNYAQRLCLGAGVWYYDIFGAFYDDPLMTRIMMEEQLLWILGNEFAELPELNAHAANLRIIGTFNHRRMTTNADLAQTHFWRRQENCTYPVDDVFVRDLGNSRLPQYRLYYIDDAIALNSAERQKIEELKRDGNVLVFQHAAGFSDWKNLSAVNISKLAGINIVESKPGVDLSDMAWKFSDTRHPLLAGTRSGELALRKGEYLAKRFAVNDASAIALGHYLDGGEVAAAVKHHKNWTAVYLPTLLPPPVLQHNLAKLAKIHVFTEAPVALRSGGRFVSVYCYNEQVSGKLHFPGKYALYEVFSGTILAPTDTVDFSLHRGDTLLYFAGTPAEVKQFADKIRKEW